MYAATSSTKRRASSAPSAVSSSECCVKSGESPKRCQDAVVSAATGADFGGSLVPSPPPVPHQLHHQLPFVFCRSVIGFFLRYDQHISTNHETNTRKKHAHTNMSNNFWDRVKILGRGLGPLRAHGGGELSGITDKFSLSPRCLSCQERGDNGNRDGPTDPERHSRQERLPPVKPNTKLTASSSGRVSE